MGFRMWLDFKFVVRFIMWIFADFRKINGTNLRFSVNSEIMGL